MFVRNVRLNCPMKKLKNKILLSMDLLGVENCDSGSTEKIDLLYGSDCDTTGYKLLVEQQSDGLFICVLEGYSVFSDGFDCEAKEQAFYDGLRKHGLIEAM